MQRRSSAVAIAVLLALVISLAACDDPPSPTSAPSGPVERWRFAVPDRYYVRVAASDAVVVAAAAPEFPELHPEERFVVALERDSGAPRWRIPLPCAPLFPAVDGDRAYLPCNDGRIRAWNLTDGSEAWNVDTRGAPVFIIPAGALLLVADGDPDDGYNIVGVDPARTPDGRVRALDAATGALRWELPLDRENAFLALEGDVLYVSTADRQAEGETLAVDPATGDVRWRTPTGSTSSRPFATADAVFVTSSAGGLYRLAAHDGRVEWRASVPGGGVYEAPVVIDGVVVAGTNVRAIYALSAVDGAIAGQRDTCDCGYDALALGNRVLTTGPGIVLLDPAGLRALWHHPTTSNVGKPAVADGWFFAPTGNVVLAFRSS